MRVVSQNTVNESPKRCSATIQGEPGWIRLIPCVLESSWSQAMEPTWHPQSVTRTSRFGRPLMSQ
jgi:hypothetical protein